MLHVLGCIIQQHDIRLVAVAGILCFFACFTTMGMIVRARAATGRLRAVWVGSAGAVGGCGIWATHFIAMLAYQAGFPVAYDIGLTVFSIIVAISLCGVGFAVAVRGHGMIGGAFTGAAISAMHYIGMWAVRAPADAVWDFRYVLASAIIGIVVSALAIEIAVRYDNFRSYALGGALFALAIVLMHFTGVSAVIYIPDPAIDVPAVVVHPLALALSICGISTLIVAVGLGSAILDSHLSERAQAEARRLRAYVHELEATKAELEKTSTNLAAALAAADAANQSKSQFLAAMSHELRTPLNAVIGFSEMISMETFGPLGHPRYHEYANDIRASGAHLLALINDVLDLSRLDSGRFELQEEKIDVVSMVASALRFVQGRATEARVTVESNLEEGIPHLYADNRRVKQVLINLLTNAVKFTPAGGRVTISAFRKRGGVAFAVKDTGIGIAKEDIPKAMERFRQIDSKLARKYEGTGLGLPLSEQLMQAHGGTLVLESELNVGTTVTVAFPSARSIEEPKTQSAQMVA